MPIFDLLELNKKLNLYLSVYPEERASLEPLLEHAGNSRNLFDRAAMPGHVTASGIVTNKKNILLIFHPILKKWLQPGGHLEAGESPFQAAKREVLEEASVTAEGHSWHKKNPIPFDIDVHAIPANPCKNELAHLHYDFRYLFCANPTVKAGTPAHQSAWINALEIGEPNLQELVLKLESRGIMQNELLFT